MKAVDSKVFPSGFATCSRSPMFSVLTVVSIVASVLFAMAPCKAQIADQDAITALLHGMFDRKDAQLMIAPIVVSGDYAIAGWSQADMGGRALLRKKEQKWSLILCAGDEIKSAHALTTAGLPSKEAVTLEHDLVAAENALPKEQVAMFSRFQGIMKMDGSGGGDHHTAHDHSH